MVVNLEQSSSATQYSTVRYPKKNLDRVFYKQHEQEQWGRSQKVGYVRTREPTARELLDRDRMTSSSTSKKTGNNGEGKEKSKSMSRNGQPLLDVRTLPKVQSRTLTIQHPEMKCFGDSDVLH
jgi:hypothetical protein